MEYECPLCGEYLEKNTKGKITFNNLSADVYFCEECNQSFAIDVGQIKFIPYDAEMKKIENECNVCKKVENFNQKGLFMLNIDTAYYKFHCFECAKPILQKWLDKNSKNNVILNDENIQDIYSIYDLEKNNEMLTMLSNNPEKKKQMREKLMKDMGLGMDDDALLGTEEVEE